MKLALVRFRELLGYSQEGVAQSVGMPQTTYSGWEKSPPKPLVLLAKLGQRHGYSVDYILGLTDDPRPASKKDISTIAQDVIECMSEMSPRGQAELLVICKSIAQVDRQWQELVNLGATHTEEESKELDTQLGLLSPNLGSNRAALRELIDREIADRARSTQGEQLQE